ncbi:MAG: hypothetical protein AAF757_18955 [Cyanobacteria bacterium P01_D01_bin.116]
MAKSNQIGIRVNKEDFDLIVNTAREQGYERYSEWCLKILLDACGKTSIEDELQALRERVEKLEKINQIQAA